MFPAARCIGHKQYQEKAKALRYKKEGREVNKNVNHIPRNRP